MNKKSMLTTIVTAVITAAVIVFGISFFVKPNSSTGSIQAKETVYERVVRTGEIRCGYFLWPGFVEIDPNTKELSGLWVDMMAALAAQVDFEVKWVEEVGLGDFIPALNNGRFDAMCSGIWLNPARALQVDFTQPIRLQTLYAYVRADDPRFDGNLRAINSADVRVTTIDGEMGDLVRKADFPEAEAVTLTQLSDPSYLFVNLTTNKADVALISPETAIKFSANNPNTIRQVKSDPLRLFHESIAVAHGAHDFRELLNELIISLQGSGEADKILDQYEENVGAFLRPAKPYILSK